LEALSIDPVLASVKCRLLNCIDFWHFIGAPKFILDIIKDGYKISFITTRLPHRFKNNASVFNEREFVNEAILELLRENRFEEIADV